MRISTSQMFYTGTTNIQNGQADLFKTQNQLSTGRRILTPKDDPVSSSLALMTTQAKAVNSSFLSNQGVATDHLAFLDSSLGSVSNLLQRAIELGTQGGNGTYSASQKQDLATELKANFDDLVNLANSKDGAGDYIFAGNRTNVQPFSVTGAGGNYSLSGTPIVSYNGDDGQRLLQVESSQTVATSESGQNVFMRVMDGNGNLNGRSVFDALKNMIDALDSGSGVVPAPSYSQALGDLQASLDHVSNIRTSVGARENQVQSLTSTGNDVSLQYDTQLSKLQNVDYAEAISRLNQQQMQLQASQQSFTKVSALSLFNFI